MKSHHVYFTGIKGGGLDTAAELR